MYGFKSTGKFSKQKDKLPQEISKRAAEAMKSILTNPYSNGIRLVGNLKGFWKKRIGNYRIIYEIIESDKIVVFHIVEHRKNVYD
jgi:mRNA interferase RelE/StbE